MGIPWVAALLSRERQDDIQYQGIGAWGRALASTHDLNKSISWALSVILVAYLPSSWGNYCESKGETSTLE